MEEDLHIFENELLKKVPYPKFRLIKNALVIGDMVYDTANYRLLNTHTHVYRPKGRTVIKRVLSHLHAPQIIDKATWIGNNWSDGYFHWMMDAIYQLASTFEQARSYMPILINPEFKEPYVRQSLEMLDFEYLTIPNHPLFVKELLFAERREAWGNYFPEVLLNLRQALLERTATPTTAPANKIYLSRVDAVRRRLKNEQELIELLLKYNIRAMRAEDFSFREQAEIFSNTSLLIAVHGAGLTNSIFLPDNAKLMEIRNRYDTQNNCYFSMAGALNLAYGYHLAEGVLGNNHSELTIDIDAFESDLNRLLNA